MADSYKNDNDDDYGSGGLKDGFDWYMSPVDKIKYEEIYTANRDGRGEITLSSLDPLYSSLDVPDMDIRSAWNLINPSGAPSIGKDATLAFLHILNYRHEGYRIPRSVPASLRASFERGRIEYDVERVARSSPTGNQRWASHRGGSDENTSTSRKAKFGDAYLSRLGVGDRTAYRPKGTDFSRSGGTNTSSGGTRVSEDWEEVRLKKQLREIEDKIERVGRLSSGNQNRNRNKNGNDNGDGDGDSSARSKPALVKRELEQLLDYKRRQLRDLETGEGSAKIGMDLKVVREDIGVVKEQVDGLETHLKKREEVLSDLRTRIEEERRVGMSVSTGSATTTVR